MPVTTAILSGNVADLTGTADPAVLATARLYIESNTTDSALLDTAGNKLMVGIEPVTIDPVTGAFTKTLVRTDSTDILPATGRMYRAHLNYRTSQVGSGSDRKTITSGWFTFTAAAGLASKWTGIETLLVPSSANLNDVAMTNVDALAASTFRVQQDARDAAKFVPQVGNTKVSLADGVTDPAILGKFETNWFEVAVNGGRNSMVGIAVNDTAAATVAYPTGITGYAKFTGAGNTAFGLFGRVDQHAAGVGTNEVNVFNYAAAPTTTYPPVRSIGTASIIPVALTVATGGTFPALIGIHISREGSEPQPMKTGIYISPNAISDYPLYIDGGAATFPSLILANGTQRGQANVAAAFGIQNLDNATGAQLLVGVSAGNTPFIGASQYNSTNSDLILMTANVERLRIFGSGTLRIASGLTLQIGTVDVLGARRTGWATATGTATRTTFATTTVTLAQLAERVKALIDDLHGTAGHGLIGA